MRKLLKSFKTEINPTEEQKVKIRKTIGTCRFIYNFYLAHNKELYDKGEKFMSSNKFRIWLNNEYLPNHPEYSWIKEAYSKAVTQAVNNEELSPQEELMQDIVSILHEFSGRLYGLRKYKKQIEKDEEIAKELQNGNKSDRRTESQNS